MQMVQWSNTYITDEWNKAKIKYLRSHLKKFDFHSNVLGYFLKLRNFRLFWRPETRKNIFLKYFIGNCPNLESWISFLSQSLRLSGQILVLVSKHEIGRKKFPFSSRKLKRLLVGHCQVALSDFWRKFTRKHKTI